MDRDNDLIELGRASFDTKGPGMLDGDDSVGLRATGLSDD